MATVPVLRFIFKNKKSVKDALGKVVTVAESVIRKAFTKTGKAIVKKMQVPGKTIKYPVKWDSEKQRRAFFATKGFGGGIPYVRRGKYEALWQFKPIRNGYEVGNRFKAAGFIAGSLKGKYQSRIHKGRWPVFRKVVDGEIKKMPSAIKAGLKSSFSKIKVQVKA